PGVGAAGLAVTAVLNGRNDGSRLWAVARVLLAAPSWLSASTAALRWIRTAYAPVVPAAPRTVARYVFGPGPIAPIWPVPATVWRTASSPAAPAVAVPRRTGPVSSTRYRLTAGRSAPAGSTVTVIFCPGSTRMEKLSVSPAGSMMPDWVPS